MTVFPSSIKNKQGFFFFFSIGEVVCSLYCTGNCRLESSCVIVTGMQRTWRRAWPSSLMSYVLQCIELSLLYSEKDRLHYLARGVFLRVSSSENKCPSCHFSNKACFIEFFTAIIFYCCDDPKEFLL